MTFKYTNLLALIALLVSFSSCSEDEEVTLTNKFSLGGSDITLVDGRVIDYGSSLGFRNYDFFLVDAPLTSTNGLSTETTTIVYAELFSRTSGSFQGGTFNFIDENSALGDIPSQSFFTTSEISIFTSGGSEYEVTGGTINVTDNGSDNFTIQFNVTVSEVDGSGNLIANTSEDISFRFTDSFAVTTP